MVSKVKGLIVAGAAASVLATAVPAAGAADAAVLGACRATGTMSTTNGMTIVVQGQYVAPSPSHITLTCYVRQGNMTVASFTSSTTGLAAVVTGTATIPPRPFDVCHTVHVRDLATGATYSESSC